MIDDARHISPGSRIETDICIIGAGAAGIALALELNDTRLKVTIIESGGLEFDGEVQRLNEGVLAGVDTTPLDASRIRVFGGTTSVWGGGSWPFSPSDFRRRAWAHPDGWPISKSDLAPHYRRAAALCKINPEFDHLDQSLKVAIASESPSTQLDPGLFVPRVEQLNPLHFGETFRNRLVESRNVTVFLRATAVEILTSSEGNKAIGLRVACLNGNEFSVAATDTVIAAGGIESVRLLQISRRRKPAGLGNDADQLGRYYMQHLYTGLGRLQTGGSFTPPKPHFEWASQDIEFRSIFTLSESATKGERIGNVSYRFKPIFQGESHKSFQKLYQVYNTIRSGKWPDNFFEAARSVLQDLDEISGPALRRFFDTERTVIGTMVEVIAEHFPNSQSRIKLSNRLDQFSNPLPQVSLTVADDDRKTMREAYRLARSELARIGAGSIVPEVALNDPGWPKYLPAGSHQLGGARMHSNPKSGVVDSHCQVHGTKHLHVASSAVFPTSGAAPPTLTILALALRLADSLKRAHGVTAT